MATKRRLIHFQTFSNFSKMKLSANDDNTQYTIGIGGEIFFGTDIDVPYQAIAFIKDTEQIWTHGKLYNNTQIIDLGTITISDSKFTFSNQDSATKIIAQNPKQPMIFKYSIQNMGDFENYCPVQIIADDSTYQYVWNDIYNSRQFFILFTHSGSDVSFYRADTSSISYETDIKELRTNLNKLSAIDNIYIVDLSQSQGLDNLQQEDDGVQNYTTFGTGVLPSSPEDSPRTAIYVRLNDGYLKGITPVVAYQNSTNNINLSFITSVQDSMMRLSFNINPSTHTAWGLSKEHISKSDYNFLTFNLGTLSSSNRSFTITADIAQLYSLVKDALDNSNVDSISVKYNNMSYPANIQSYTYDTTYYAITWITDSYIYEVQLLSSTKYIGQKTINDLIGTSLTVSNGELQLLNDYGQALTKVNLNSTISSIASNYTGYRAGQYNSSGEKKGWKITSSVKTKLWKAYLLQVYSNSNTGIPFNTTIQTFTNNEGEFTRSKLVNYGNNYSDVIVYENSDGYTTFWIGAKGTYEQPIFRLFSDLPSSAQYQVDDKISKIEYVDKPTDFPNGYTQIEVFMDASKDLTLKWDGTLNFNNYKYAYAAISESKTLTSIDGPEGKYYVSLYLNKPITLTLKSISNVRYLFNGYIINPTSISLPLGKLILFDIDIFINDLGYKIIQINIIDNSQNDLGTNSYGFSTAYNNSIYYRDTTLPLSSVIDSMVSAKSRGVFTFVYKVNTSHDIKLSTTRSGWKVFKNGIDESFPVTLTSGIYSIRITKWDASNALVEITG